MFSSAGLYLELCNELQIGRMSRQCVYDGVPVDFTAGFFFFWGCEYVCSSMQDTKLGRER